MDTRTRHLILINAIGVAINLFAWFGCRPNPEPPLPSPTATEVAQVPTVTPSVTLPPTSTPTIVWLPTNTPPPVVPTLGEVAELNCGSGMIEIVEQTGELLIANCTPLPTSPPTATNMPIPGRELLNNPQFIMLDGECPQNQVETPPEWTTNQYFQFANKNARLFPSEDDCVARAKKSTGTAPGIVPPGESGKLWQVVNTGPYSTITFWDIHAEHEDGDVWHRIYGCNDANGNDCVLLVETDLRIPQLTSKQVCHIYKQVIVANIDGTINHSVEHSVPGCQTELPDPVTFNVSPFGEYDFLKVEVEVVPSSGDSGYESDEWSLTTQ